MRFDASDVFVYSQVAGLVFLFSGLSFWGVSIGPWLTAIGAVIIIATIAVTILLFILMHVRMDKEDDANLGRFSSLKRWKRSLKPSSSRHL